MADAALARRRPARLSLAALPASALSGAAAGLGQVPFSLIPVSLAGFAALIWLVAGAPRIGRAALLSWLGGTGYFLATLYWIVEPFYVDAERDAALAPVALTLCAIGFALFWGAAGALSAIARHPAARALAFAGALTVGELARGYILTGFPWALPAYGWSETGAIGLAAWIGPYGLTLLTLALAAWAAGALHARRPVLAAAAAIVALALPVAGGLSLPPPAPAEGRPIVRLVQPNAPQAEKWIPERAREYLIRQIDYTAAASIPRPDLVVWPETSIPYVLDLAQTVIDATAEAGRGSPVVVGGLRREGERFYNHLAVVQPDGRLTDGYDKYHLVPFGEYVPRAGILGMVTRTFSFLDERSSYTPGDGPRLIDLPGIGPALPLICYEAIFPQDVGAAPSRPALLLQITNDAWFGTFAGPQMHLAQARFRAVEQGVPLIRAANTGISAVIDAGGRVTASIPLDKAGWLDAAVPPAAAPTLYSRTGDGPALVLALCLAGLAIAIGRRGPIEPRTVGR